MTRTSYQVARHFRKVINMDHAVNDGDSKKVMCAWDTCEKDGYELYKVVQETARVDLGYASRTLTYIFCCEKHRQYYINSLHNWGNAPGYLH